MTSRKRVLTTLDHREPDRVPIQVDFTPEVATKLSAHLKTGNATVEAYSGKIFELPIVIGHDLLIAWHGIATSYYQYEDQKEYTCEWGIKWQWVEYPEEKYTERVESPLKDGTKLSSYSCPGPSESWRYDAVRSLVKKRGTTNAIAGAMTCTLFEAAWYLRGMDLSLSDLIMNKGFVNELLNKQLDFQLVTGTILAKLGVDIIWIGNDFGIQDSVIISPSIWREFFKPRAVIRHNSSIMGVVIHCKICDMEPP